jgi:hypothetical protein
MADLDQIHAELVALRGELMALRSAQASALRPVLSVAEAMSLVGAESSSAFYRWTALWRVKPSATGRYARRALAAGLDREVAGTARRKSRAITLLQQPAKAAA